MTNSKFITYGLKIASVFSMFFLLPTHAADNHTPSRLNYYAPHADKAPKVDDTANEIVWQLAEWQNLDQLWLGPKFSKNDFQGRYKVHLD